jgi:hypothetical protein
MIVRLTSPDSRTRPPPNCSARFTRLHVAGNSIVDAGIISSGFDVPFVFLVGLPIALGFLFMVGGDTLWHFAFDLLDLWT